MTTYIVTVTVGKRPATYAVNGKSVADAISTFRDETGLDSSAFLPPIKADPAVAEIVRSSAKRVQKLHL